MVLGIIPRDNKVSMLSYIYVDVSRPLETQVDRMLSQSRRRQHRPIIKNQDRAGVGKRSGRHNQALLTAGTIFPPANELQRRAQLGLAIAATK